MRTLICDRPRAELENLAKGPSFDLVFCLEDLVESGGGRDGRSKQGGRSEQGGKQERDLADIGTTDELWVVASSFYGQVGLPVLRALEQAAGAASRNAPSTVSQATPQAATPAIHIWLHGVDENSYEERGLARMLASRLALELGGTLAECRVIKSFDLGLLKQLGSLPPAGGASLPLNRTEQAPASDPRPASPASPAHPTLPAAPLGTARRIALLDAGPVDGAASALLDDFEDALLAYDRLSSRALDVAGESAPPSFVRLAPAKSAPHAGAAQAEALGSREAEALRSCDVLVIGYPVSLGALPARVANSLGNWGQAGAIRTGTRVYAICTVDGSDAQAAHLSLEVLRLFCEAYGLVWGGGLCVPQAPAVASFAPAERMGWKRRGRSEAIDHLIGAVRAGLSIADAARRFGSSDLLAPSNIINAPCALPRWAYNVVRQLAARL